MIECANRVVLLCDRTKIGRTSFAQSVPTEKIDVLVTDFLSEEDRALLEESGVEVIVASAGASA